jgi:sulfoxide reductase heme-binding subunit YedZ
MAPWIIGRSSGICAYVLLVALVVTGLSVAGPPRRGSGLVSRMRLHVALAAGTAVFTVLHVVVLVTDRYAGVGVVGALVPFGASYRPVATTMGLLGLWTGVAAGATAALAGRFTGRIWLPIHKLAVVALISVWLHGVYAGSDASALRWFYIGSGVMVALFAWWRYARRRPTDVDVHATFDARTTPMDVVEVHAVEPRTRTGLVTRGA